MPKLTEDESEAHRRLKAAITQLETLDQPIDEAQRQALALSLRIAVSKLYGQNNGLDAEGPCWWIRQMQAEAAAQAAEVFPPTTDGDRR